MAKYVHEITNPELFHLRTDESVANALLGILALRITAAPVLSDAGEPVGMIALRDLLGEGNHGCVSERMSRPAHVISVDATIAEAGRAMAEHDVHQLVAVDGAGRAVGVLSSMDVMRALLGIPVCYPDAFPHRDAQGLTWTDPIVLDGEHALAAPDGPGLFVLIRGGTDQPEVPVWAEAASNVRSRISELLAIPQTDASALARILAHEPGQLRFRSAAVADPSARATGLRRVREDVAGATGLPARLRPF